MPKGKKKDRQNYKGRNNGPVSDDETETLDTVSAVSSLSDQQATITDGSTDVEVDETTAQGNLEDKFHMHIEGISQRSTKGRVESLQSLRAILSQKYLLDNVSQNKLTILEYVERSLKKGKGEEQYAAAMCGVLVIVQLGTSEEAEEVFRSFSTILKVVLSDMSASCTARAACAEALGLCAFIAAEENQTIDDTMLALEDIFKIAYNKSDRKYSPEIFAVLNSALAAWTLLLSIASSSFVQSCAKTYICKLSEMLTSDDMELRITAGEAIALLFERGRTFDEDFDDVNFTDLYTLLRGLSTESNKYRAKKDRRQQKSSFRDILCAVEEGYFVEHKLKVNAFDTVLIDSWALKTQYNALCHIIGSGMNMHLQENQLLRDIFCLGAPIAVNSVPLNKSSKQERHMMYDAASKFRTKCRKKMRDIKCVGATGD